MARYYPFGAWRTTPSQTLTDRGYTGHLENMEIGLVYMNARYYVPAIGRFASADTVVPGLDNPQAWNRYAYVANNPLVLTDPSGHCWGFASGLRNTFMGTTCSNLDMAATIVASPDATIAQRAFAGGYIVAEAAAGTMLAVGGAILVAEAAPVAAGYAGTAVMQAQATTAAHPVAAGVVGGVLETAAECTMTGGGCGADTYLMGALTGGISSATASAARGSGELDQTLYAFGNKSGPRPPRAGTDVFPDSSGIIRAQNGLDMPDGASTFADISQVNLRGHYHSLAAGTVLPKGLGVKADGSDVVRGSTQPPTHHTIFATRDMHVNEFSNLFSSLPWQYAGRK